jgi:hypothetical protein
MCVPGNSEIRNRLLEGGRVLALLIGDDFPVANDVWLGVNRFNQIVCDNNIEDTWVTMITSDDRDVSDVSLVCWFVSRSLMPYGRLYCRA